MNQTDVKTAVADLLLALPGIGGVDTRRGGLVTWAKNGVPKQPYWIVQIATETRQQGDLGTLVGRMSIDYALWIDGYLPLSYADKSEDTFSAVTDAVLDTLTDARIGGLFTADEEANVTFVPDLTQNDLQLVSGGTTAGDGIVCTHARIEWTVREYRDFNRR